MSLHNWQNKTNIVQIRVACLFVATFLLAVPAAVSDDSDLAEPAKNAEDDGFVNSAVWTEDLASISDSLVTPVACTGCGDNHPYNQCQGDRWVDIWDGRMEIGLNGAEGNSRNVNLVVGFDAKQVAGADTLTHDVDYLFSRDDIETTKNRFYSLSRWEHDIQNSDWGTFADVWFEYDELESFRARLGLHTGGVVTLVKTNECLFKGLIGIGASKEMAGADTDWRPEAFLGSHWEKTITSRQNFYLKSVIFPDIGDAGEFRFNARAG
ncbi:MAG: DUF481 domain-containing protein [Fuerstiella sp.]|nr:DUF481 domain-containing protein [Fuerstiella sp.]MCP4857302.1 DUF481 domain-containing protein [Fuerstiella sp.]